jgi:ubiquitin thioesterase OTU1
LHPGAVTSVAVPNGSGSVVVRREIASDNSCLFNAVGYVMEGTRNRASELRWGLVHPSCFLHAAGDRL